MKNYTETAICFWSWNGDMRDEEIREQIAQFAENGLGGFIIHARAGLSIPYMGTEWFRACNTAVEVAKSMGLEVWLYDEDGWPSGFAAGLVPAKGNDYCLKTMTITRERQKAREADKVIAVYKEESNGNYVRVRQEDGADGDLFFYYTIDRHYADLLNPEAVEYFIHVTHDEYKNKLGQYFGNTFKGVFTDEPQISPYGYPWGNALPEFFKEENGYDLLDSLWLLNGQGENSNRFRLDFWTTVNCLFQKSFTGRIARWCAENGLAMTGHFAAEDGLCGQIGSCGGVMTQYVHMQLPGIDHLGNRLASVLLMKQVSSVSNQFGDGQVLSETFGCSGWSVSFSELDWIWGWESSLGVTKPCFHLAAYTIKGIRKRDYPAFFSYQEPWWDCFRGFTKWINGLNHLMQDGRREVHTLILSPLFGVMRHYLREPNQCFLSELYSSQMRQLAENLLDIQVDFEVADEQLLDRFFDVKGGSLCVNNSCYNLAFVAQTDYLSEKTMALLKKFTMEGGTLVFVNERPRLVGSQRFTAEVMPNAYDIRNRKELIEKFIEYLHYERPVEIRNKDFLKIASGFAVHTRLLENGDKRIHIWHGEVSATKEVVVRVKGNRMLYRVDPAAGSRKALPTYPDGKGYVYTNLTVGGRENVLLETGRTADAKIRTPLCKELLLPVSIQLGDLNCLTIDRAAASVNDQPQTKEMPVIHLVDLLYSEVQRSDEIQKIQLIYHFNCGDAEVLEDEMMLDVEDERCEKIEINGHPVHGPARGWWIDKFISEYSITPYVRQGLNTVSLYYNIPKGKNTINVKDIFETERNRFSYPVEPENIYIRGTFDVKAAGHVVNRVDHYSIENAEFSLVKKTVKKYNDLTPQNLWFYRGSAKYTFHVECSGEEPGITLSVGGIRGSLVRALVNGRRELMFCPPYELDIGNLLHPGSNEIVLELIGTNRNVLGPHHHICGENYFVGMSIFKGQKGFEDFVSPSIRDDDTWTDDYSFIPFSLDEVSLQYYSEKTDDAAKKAR